MITKFLWDIGNVNGYKWVICICEYLLILIRISCCTSWDTNSGSKRREACVLCVLCSVWGYTLTQCTVHTPHRSQYTAITLTTSCTISTYLLLTKCVIFNYVLTVAPCWWFPCKPKHVGEVLFILKYFNNSTFFNVVCVSWKLKCWLPRI